MEFKCLSHLIPLPILSSDLESDSMTSESLKRLFDIGCYEDCQRRVLERLRRFEDPNRRYDESLPISGDYVVVRRRRRAGQAPAEKITMEESREVVILPQRLGLSRKHFQRASHDSDESKRGKQQKVIIPKRPQLHRNISSNDRRMIDWQARGLNQLEIEKVKCACERKRTAAEIHL